MVSRVATADPAAVDDLADTGSTTDRPTVERSPFDALVAAVRYRLAGGTTEWTARAACRGADTARFFPDDTTQAGTRAALEAVARFCDHCPVHVDCLATAVIGSEVGLWAGTDDRQRAALAVRLRRAGVLLPGDGATVVAIGAARRPASDPTTEPGLPGPQSVPQARHEPHAAPTAAPALSEAAPPPDLLPLLERLPAPDRWTLLVRLERVAEEALAAALADAASAAPGTELTARRRNDGAVDVFAKRCAA